MLADFHSPPGGSPQKHKWAGQKCKSLDVRRKMYTLIYPDPKDPTIWLDGDRLPPRYVFKK